MSFVQVDGTFHSHPKVVLAGNAAVGLYIRLMCWAAEQKGSSLTAPDRLVRLWGTPVQVKRAVNAGLMEPVDGGFLLSAEVCRPRQDGWRPAIPASIRRFVFERDGYACLKCGATEDLTLDHVHPWSLGGPDTAENLQTLCRSCNSSKGARI